MISNSVLSTRSADPNSVNETIEGKHIEPIGSMWQVYAVNYTYIIIVVVTSILCFAHTYGMHLWKYRKHRSPGSVGTSHGSIVSRFEAWDFLCEILSFEALGKYLQQE